MGRIGQFQKGKQPASHKEKCGCFRCSRIPWNKGKIGVIKQSEETIAKRVAKLKGHKPFKLANPNAKEIRRVKELFYMKRRRSRKNQAQGLHTLQEWELLKEYFSYMCLCCKRQEPEIRLTEDHIVPLSKGGSDYIDNIQPLCGSCNAQKYTKSISYLPSSFKLSSQGERGVI